ncbi:Os06g0567433, partial [Oryza sativa Japonica Group]
AGHERGGGGAAGDGRLGELADAVDGLGEDDAHAHVEVRLDVAVERPHPGVVRHEPDRRPPVREDHRRVPQRRVSQVQRRRVAGVAPERAVAVAQHPEVVPVEVPRVHLADVPRQRVRVLEHHVHRRVVREHVHVVAHRGVRVRRRPHHVVPAPERVGRPRRRRERRPQPHLEGPQVRRRREHHGHVVDRPLHVPAAHPVLRVEQLDAPVRRRRRRRRDAGAAEDAVRERLAAREVVPRRGGRRRRRRQPGRAVGAVVEHGQRWRRPGLPAAHADADPVVRRRVLVRRQQHGVAVAGVDVDVVDGERLHVVPVGLHHRQLVILLREASEVVLATLSL